MSDVAAYHVFVRALFPLQGGMSPHNFLYCKKRTHKYMMLPRHS
jgi:hypothetical protein